MEIENKIDSESNSTLINRLGSCEVCNKNESKYTCPRCELKTCCLECSKIHKKELECSGIRDRAKFIPLKKMTSMDFMNDFYFLEEATRFTKNIIENPAVNRKGCLNFKFVKLKKEAFKRNIKLYLVNNGLSKRRKNYSSYKGQEDTIYWQIELIFPNAENLKLTRKFSEKIILQDVIRNVLETTSANERLAKQLEFYRAEGANKLRCLLKAEGLKRCKQRYFEMDSEKSLKANLMGKVIIEFPSIHVVMRHSADCFEVVDSDDEEQVQNEIKNFRQTVHDEVLSKKIGENPPIAELKPEEIPLIATMFADKVEESQTPLETVYHAAEDFDIKSTEDDVEGEVEPQNYFF